MGLDSSASSYSEIEVESVLRLRPLLKKEKEDIIVLEHKKNDIRNGPATVVLHPLHPSLASPTSHRSRADFDAGSSNTPTRFHFNHVLDETTSQDKIYYTIGLPLATAAISSLKNENSSPRRGPKNHLLICMGVVNSGKTYTCFGGGTISKRRASEDGLVPRLVDSLFSQSKHHASNGSKGFALQLSVSQVTHSKGSDPHSCQIHDLLAPPSKSGSPKKSPSKNVLTVRSMAARFEQAIPSPILSPLKSAEFAELDVEDPKPTIESCRDAAQAREVLQNGLNASKKAAKGRNFHLLITIQPVLNGTRFGDKISILDMAGLDKGKRGHNRGKDRVASKNQAANAAVLHCLRTLIHNTNVRSGQTPVDIHCIDDMASEISCVSQEKDPMHDQEKPVPFRQHKVSMLLQPLFSTSSKTKVTILMTAYTGHADHQEKRLLLQDVEVLHGSSLIGAPTSVATGFEPPQSSRSLMSSESRSNLSEDTRDDDVSVVDPVEKARIARKFYDAPKLKASRNSGSSSISNDSSHVSRRKKPPAYAPWRATSSHPNSTLSDASPVQVAPSAPPLDDVSTNPVSDFPGISLPPKELSTSPMILRQKSSTVMDSNISGGHGARAPPFYDEESNASDPKNSCSSPISNGRNAVGGNYSRDQPYYGEGAPSQNRKYESRLSPRSKGRNVVHDFRSKPSSSNEDKVDSRNNHNNRPSPRSKRENRAPLGRSSLENGCIPAMDGKQSKHNRTNGINGVESSSASTENTKFADTSSENHSCQSTVTSDSQSWTKESRGKRENPLDIPDLRVQVRGIRATADPSYDDDNRREKSNQLSPRSKIRDTRAPLGCSSVGNENQINEDDRQSKYSRTNDVKEVKQVKNIRFADPHSKNLNSQSVVTNDRQESQIQRENLFDHSDLRMQSRMDRSADVTDKNKENSLNEQVREMERKMKEILAQKHSLEERCNDLEKENKKLKIDLREVGRGKRQDQWTSQDEKEFLESRRIRREDQSLVKGPLLAHMEKVNYIYGIKNQCFITNKPHFTLSIPRTFQRAPDLDIRDKKNEEMEKRNAEMNSTLHVMPPIKLSFDQKPLQTASTTTTAPVVAGRIHKKTTNRSSMSALKKLAQSR